jgi:protein-S-isoprenylcysteine O-methyltransferase Ste14
MAASRSGLRVVREPPAGTPSMLIVLRHLLAVLVLPFVVVVVVPYRLLASNAGADTPWELAPPVVWVARATGLAVGICGLGLFIWCLSLFARVGRGTLAPWDPPREFVAVGPYRRVRNPMITSVVTMLAGQALIWGSRAIGEWALVFALFNHMYFVLIEEPGLAQRFGQGYLTYKANVPRWLPRRKAWEG